MYMLQSSICSCARARAHARVAGHLCGHSRHEHSPSTTHSPHRRTARNTTITDTPIRTQTRALCGWSLDGAVALSHNNQFGDAPYFTSPHVQRETARGHVATMDAGPALARTHERHTNTYIHAYYIFTIVCVFVRRHQQPRWRARPTSTSVCWMRMFESYYGCDVVVCMCALRLPSDHEREHTHHSCAPSVLYLITTKHTDKHTHETQSTTSGARRVLCFDTARGFIRPMSDRTSVSAQCIDSLSLNLS